jgi:hypothetical protein
MPPNPVEGQELTDIIRFVRSIEASPEGGPRGGPRQQSFGANAANWHSSPMAYQFDGKEYIVLVSGDNVNAMSIPD